jgi:hypothetical protein
MTKRARLKNRACVQRSRARVPCGRTGVRAYSAPVPLCACVQRSRARLRVRTARTRVIIVMSYTSVVHVRCTYSNPSSDHVVAGNDNIDCKSIAWSSAARGVAAAGGSGGGDARSDAWVCPTGPVSDPGAVALVVSHHQSG